MIPETRETNQGPWTTLPLRLEAVSKPWAQARETSHEVHCLGWAGWNQSWEDKAAKVTKIRETENWRKNYPEKELPKSTRDLLSSCLNLRLRPSEKLLLRKNNYQEAVNWKIPRAHTKQEIFLVPTNQKSEDHKRVTRSWWWAWPSPQVKSKAASPLLLLLLLFSPKLCPALCNPMDYIFHKLKVSLGGIKLNCK